MSAFKRVIAEIHRRSLWQVLGVYAVASWVIWQVVVSLYEGIGLPDWVPGTALVLLLIGLPIVLATAFVQEGAPRLRGVHDGARVEGLEHVTEAVERSSNLESRSAENGSRRPDLEARGRGGKRGSPTSIGFFTWPRAITGGVLAFAALGMAASGFMGMRALGIGPAGTLIGKGVLEANDPLVLADFQSTTGDSVLALTLTDAFRVGLEQSRAVQLASADRVADALQRMRRDRGEPLGPTLAREVGQREGLKAYIGGDVSSVGPSFVVTVRVVSVATGEPLVSLNGMAEDSSALIPAVGSLAADLRERIGESLRSIRATPALAQVTTSSLPALRKYAQAWRVSLEHGDRERARALMEEAIAEDSAFAMAWRGLGVFLWDVGERSEMIEALTRAYELSERLPERERYHARAIYYSDVMGDRPRAIEAYETLLELYPEDGRALHNLAREYASLLSWERSGELYRRRIELNPDGALSRRNLLFHYQVLGRWTAYDSVAQDYAGRFPDHPQIRLHAAVAASARGDHAAAASAIDSLARNHPGRSWQKSAAWQAGHVAAARGRVREARRHFARYIDLAGQVDAPADRIRGAVSLAFYEAMLLGEIDAAIHRVEAALAEQPLAELSAFDRPYLTLASFYAAAGETERARGLLGAYADSTPAANRSPGAELFARRTEGLAAIVEGRVDEGLAQARAWPEGLRCNGCADLDLGRAFDLAGRPDSALHYYERGIEHRAGLTTVSAGFGWSLPFLGSIYARAAELHEERGDRATAVARYQDLIRLWQDADPELQPRVEAARRALARLTGEGGR